MKLIIAGSRFEQDEFGTRLNDAAQFFPEGVTEVVSGTARGYDRVGEQLALRNGVPVKRMPAVWERYGKSAGMKRNVEMGEYADALLAFWNGKSSGTRFMIEWMQKNNKPVTVINVKE